MRLSLLLWALWIPGASASLWTELAENFALPSAPSDVRLVVEQARWLKGDEVAKLARARPWIAYIYNETLKRRLPAELALLPFVESAFDPTAVSSAEARGMWQFIGSTGRQYGLTDEGGCQASYDVIRSTDAALDHLRDLHRATGDWHLALAAYNAGLDRVKRAQKANLAQGLPTDYWHLDGLPRETRNYVPRLIALRDLLVEQLLIQQPVPTLPNRTVLYRQSTPPDTWLNLSKRSGISERVLRRLNPCWQSGPGMATEILMPINLDAARQIEQWLW